MRSILEVSFEQLQKYYYVLMENSSFETEKRRNENKLRKLYTKPS